MAPTAITVPVEQDSGAARLDAAEQRLPETLDPESLCKYFTLTETDLQEVAVCRGVVNKLGFAVQLCTLRWQGHFLGDTRGLPAPVLETLALQLGLLPMSIDDYPQNEKTRWEHLERIRQHLRFQQCDDFQRRRLLKHLTETAQALPRSDALRQEAWRWLQEQRIVRPGRTTLRDLLTAAREGALQQAFVLLARGLTAEQREQLDALLVARMADRRAAQRQHLPYLTHGHPDAAQSRPKRAEQIQLSFQTHDHRGRADRAGSVALVLQRGRQAGGGDRRYLVANGKRGLPVQYQAGAGSHEAGQHRTRGAGDVSRHLGRRREGGPGRLRPGRKHLHPQPVAGNLPNHLGRSRAVPRNLLPQILQGPEKQGLARLAILLNDGAMQAADGYYRILGRVDDVINVAGHRLGTKELESACLTCDEVAEAAVVPVVDEVRGRVPEIYIALKPGLTPSKTIEDKIVRAIETTIGKIARPKGVRIVPDMPKTRSGKIMRRVLASISNTMDIGDVTTLANPEIVEQIRIMVQGEAKVATKAGPEDIKSFGQE
jgi:hypothetical protein